MRLWGLILTVLALLGPASTAAAQARRAEQPPPRLLEQRLRQEMARIVKQRLGLTDQQVLRLRGVVRTHEQQRRVLHQQERETRRALRAEMLKGDSAADQRQVSVLLERMLDIQRRRLEIAEAEQRELAAFLTPVQRVKYHTLQEQFRRRVEELQRRRQARDGAP